MLFISERVLTNIGLRLALALPHLLVAIILGLSEEVYSSRPQIWSFIRENFQLYGLFTFGLLRVWYEPCHSMIIWSYNADVNCK